MTFPYLFCALLIATPAFAFQQDAAHERDVYAIYSLMLTNPQTSRRTEENQRYLIAATTGRPQPEEPCAGPPPERAADFAEAVADYHRRRTTPRQLTNALSISKPYALLTPDEVAEFVRERRNPQLDRAAGGRFPGVTDLFTLWDVSFNDAGTLALTGISTWCGMTCGYWQWKVFERLDDGRWEERRWPTCVTVARSLAPTKPR